MSSDYGWEIFHSATLSLVGSGSQRERLVAAYRRIILVIIEDVPPELRDILQTLKQNITRVEAKDEEGRIQATVDSMEDTEVDQMTEHIISMYDTITRYQKPF